jgi:hypothetical protein
MPFYGNIAREVRSRREKAVHIVVVTTDDAQTASDYLAAHGLEVDEVVPGTALPAKVFGTPTLVLASHEGVVRDAWVGKLDASREREVRKALGL